MWFSALSHKDLFKKKKNFFLAQPVGLREDRAWPELKQPFHQETPPPPAAGSTEIKLCLTPRKEQEEKVKEANL